MCSIIIGLKSGSLKNYKKLNDMFYFKKSPRQIVNVRFRATVNVILKHGMNSEGIVMDVVHPINAVQNTKEIARTTQTAL